MVPVAVYEEVRTTDGSGDAPPVGELEDSLAEIADFPFAIAVSSGTAAVASLLRASGVRPGDRVGVSALARSATGLAVLVLGAEPMFLDMAPGDSFGLDPQEVEAAVDAGCKAVVPVPLWGYWNEDSEALARARTRGCRVVVDAAEAPFLRTSPSLSGLVDGMALSLNGRMPLKAGEGGACLTADPALAAAVATLRSFGQGAVPQGRHLEANGRPGDAFGVDLKINGLGAEWCLAQARNAADVYRHLEQDRLLADFCFRRARVPFEECGVAASVVRSGAFGFAAVCADEADKATLERRLAETGVEPDSAGWTPIYANAVFAGTGARCAHAETLARRVVAVQRESIRKEVKRGLAA
jgi:dTDP-4-amino-4,6-dideoxygalactose transaminase